jgi:hypothetical protein
MNTVIKLDCPIIRGEGNTRQEIAEVVVRKPSSGELRRLSIKALLEMETDAIIEIAPRITTPIILREDAQRMDPADFMQLGLAVVGFFIPKGIREEQEQILSASPSE